MAINLVNKGDLAAIFGIGERQISIYQKEGMPYILGEGRGKENEYNTQEVYRWLLTKFARNGLDLDGERAKLAKEQAEAVKRKNALAKGEVISLEDAKLVGQRAASVIRQSVMTDPDLSHAAKKRVLDRIQVLRGLDWTQIADEEGAE